METEKLLRLETNRASTALVAAFHLDYRDGHFVDMIDGSNRDDIVSCYSRMKFGSVADMHFLAKEMALSYLQRLNQPERELLAFFERMAKKSEHVIIFAPAFRNVESASNKLVETAVKLINVELARRGLPTIIISKLTRLFSAPANYATLTAEERAATNASAGTIDPDQNCFRLGIHAIFGDDIKITGSTANDLKQKCLSAGARSYSELYAIATNPQTASQMPQIEETFNRFAVKGSLDEQIAGILNQADFRPVQRLLRLMLNSQNREDLAAFLLNPKRTPNHALVRLYLGALNNDYGKDERYQESVKILTTAAQRRGLTDASGWPSDFSLI